MSNLLDNDADFPAMGRLPRRVSVRAASSQERVGQNHDAPLDIELPGSKYYTLRFLLNALLAEGESVVRFPAVSEDTAVLVHALAALGAKVSWEPQPSSTTALHQLRILGTGGRLSSPTAPLPMGNAGAVLRLLLGIGALLPEVAYSTDHPDSLGRRPNADLLTALASLGIHVESEGADGHLPITLRGGPPQGGTVSISGQQSSQYLSALLYLGPMLPLGLDIHVLGNLRSRSLVQATLRALAAAGIRVEASPDLSGFRVPGGQTFRAGTYDVPGDGPSAAALLGAALALRRPLRLGRLAVDHEEVGALLQAFGALGAEIAIQPGENGVGGLVSVQLIPSLQPDGTLGLRGAHIDGDSCIDSVPVLVAVACFAEGESQFEQVATLRLKESDRINDLCAELKRAGALAFPGDETITIRGQPGGITGGVTVNGHDDHRLVQALAIAGLRSTGGLTIEGADAVAKSYPDFFAVLQRCGAEVQES
jgi:3-phosphoshikimate 1-carboxyvinyltransferase